MTEDFLNCFRSADMDYRNKLDTSTRGESTVQKPHSKHGNKSETLLEVPRLSGSQSQVSNVTSSAGVSQVRTGTRQSHLSTISAASATSGVSTRTVSYYPASGFPLGKPFSGSLYPPSGYPVSPISQLCGYPDNGYPGFSNYPSSDVPGTGRNILYPCLDFPESGIYPGEIEEEEVSQPFLVSYQNSTESDTYPYYHREENQEFEFYPYQDYPQFSASNIR